MQTVYRVTGTLCARVSGGPKAGIWVNCVLGGTLFGIFNYVFPLTVGSGEAVMGPVVQGSASLSSGLLISSAFMKMVTFHTCSAGLVGGTFFPLLLTELLTGQAVAD